MRGNSTAALCHYSNKQKEIRKTHTFATNITHKIAYILVIKHFETLQFNTRTYILNLLAPCVEETALIMYCITVSPC